MRGIIHAGSQVLCKLKQVWHQIILSFYRALFLFFGLKLMLFYSVVDNLELLQSKVKHFHAMVTRLGFQADVLEIPPIWGAP